MIIVYDCISVCMSDFPVSNWCKTEMGIAGTPRTQLFSTANLKLPKIEMYYFHRLDKGRRK
jgi:hypothetical protein